MTDSAPQMNGPTNPSGKFIDSINPDDPEYQRQMRRPAEVKEDVRQMEDRQRVKLVLNSQQFREELEQIVEEQLKSGSHPASLIALQQLSDLLLPHSRLSQGGLMRGSAPVIPINDLRGVESLGYSKAEKLLRCKLASLYRVVDLRGLSEGIYNHISARISQEHEHFLINPFGLLYSEVTASSLVKADVRGEILDAGSTVLGINKAGFTLHSAIHQARPDIKCALHLHSGPIAAVSSMKCGLLPLSIESLICSKVSYHDFNGILVDPEEKEQLARNLGPVNKILFLRNHGVVACGETIEEAFYYAFMLTEACQIQIRALSAGLDNLVLVDSETAQKTHDVGAQPGGGVDTSGKKWRTGEMEFEAEMRQLDNAGYRTGYVYKQPLVKQEKRERVNSEVEIPPASSSFTYYDGDLEQSKYVSPLKTALERQKKQGRAGWLVNTPNSYVREEIEETGTDKPKKITKWVADGDSPKRSSAVKVDDPNQFAPQGANPKEFKERQKQIKKDYYEERVSAGPQSKVLEGISWDEVQRMTDGNLSGASDNVVVIGAASKGIIQKNYQHNAVVYRSAYAANPFENMSENDIAEYKRSLGQKDGEPESTEEIGAGEPQPQVEMDEVPDTIDVSHEIQPSETMNGEVESIEPPSEPAKHVQRSESDRQPAKRPEMVAELKENFSRSKSERKPKEKEFGKPGSPSKSDTLRSTDSASGGETLEDRSSKEGSPTKEAPSPTKDKKKKKKFRMPSFSSKSKKKESSM